MFWQPTATFEPLAAGITVGSRTGDGKMAISSRVCPATSGKKASTNALASAGVLYIFQLAAISFLRGIVDEVLKGNFIERKQKLRVMWRTRECECGTNGLSAGLHWHDSALAILLS